MKSQDVCVEFSEELRRSVLQQGTLTLSEGEVDTDNRRVMLSNIYLCVFAENKRVPPQAVIGCRNVPCRDVAYTIASCLV